MQIQGSAWRLPSDLLEHCLTGRVTFEDALYLFNRCAPLELFALAEHLCQETCGNIVTYVINRNINFTNRCIGTCKFCAFRQENGYLLSLDEIMAKVREAVSLGASEICIQGGLLSNMYLEDYCEILETIKSEFPHLHLHAYSPMEVFHAARNSGTSVKNVLVKLKQSGLGSMPGTAAEILSPRVRSIICPEKLTAQQWLDIVELAHNTGIPTTATMMYGHVETIEERIQHLLSLRALQMKTGGFTEFVPLPFMSSNNTLGHTLKHKPATTTNRINGIDDLKVHAIARIILHTHINNIQASWVKLGFKLAQIALHCGANDLGGTLMEEKISKSAGATTGEYTTPEEFNHLIKNTGRQPAIRDTLYTNTLLQ